MSNQSAMKQHSIYQQLILSDIIFMHFTCFRVPVDDDDSQEDDSEEEYEVINRSGSKAVSVYSIQLYNFIQVNATLVTRAQFIIPIPCVLNNHSVIPLQCHFRKSMAEIVGPSMWKVVVRSTKMIAGAMTAK